MSQSSATYEILQISTSLYLPPPSLPDFFELTRGTVSSHVSIILPLILTLALSHRTELERGRKWPERVGRARISCEGVGKLKVCRILYIKHSWFLNIYVSRSITFADDEVRELQLHSALRIVNARFHRLTRKQGSSRSSARFATSTTFASLSTHSRGNRGCYNRNGCQRKLAQRI